MVMADLDTLGGRNEVVECSQKPGNDVCADCEAKETTWVSLNLGVFVCNECAEFHRQAGPKYSKIRAFEKAIMLSLDDLQFLNNMGNIVAKTVYEARCPSYYLRPSQCPDSREIREMWVFAKYVHKYFINKDFEEDRMVANLEIGGSDENGDAAANSSSSLDKDEALLPCYHMPQSNVDGWLSLGTKKKKSGEFKWAQEDFFVLSGNMLQIYSFPHESVPKKTVNIADSRIDFIVQRRSFAKTEHRFRVELDDRTTEMFFRVEEPSNAFMWVHALRRASLFFAGGKIGAPRGRSYSKEEVDTVISPELLEKSTFFGKLTKQASKGTGTTKRYYAIIEGSLYSFRDKKHKQCNGSVSLADVTLQEKSSRSVRIDKKRSFLLVTSGRSFFMTASDDAQYDEWIKALRDAIEKCAPRTDVNFQTDMVYEV
eukprot:202310_1